MIITALSSCGLLVQVSNHIVNQLINLAGVKVVRSGNQVSDVTGGGQTVLLPDSFLTEALSQNQDAAILPSQFRRRIIPR